MSNGVTRFLASGTDGQLTDFHLRVCFLLNAIERRGQTVFYTCMGEDREEALRAAGKAGVTLQELRGQDWNVVVPGDHPGWRPGAETETCTANGEGGAHGR
jgi:hypothetical protein